jgi:hypothetical protein
MFARNVAAITPAPVNRACATVAETTDTLQNATFPLVDFVARRQVCFTDQDRYRRPTDPEEAEYMLALAELVYGYFAWLDAAPGAGGLRDYIDPAREFNLGGGSLTFTCLNAAYNLVVANNGRPTVIMSSSRELRTYEGLCWAAGFAPPQMPWRWYNHSKGAMEDGLVTQFNGTPWLINGCMAGEASADPDDARIYFMVLGDDGSAGPTQGVTGIAPADRIGQPFVKRTTNGTQNFAGGPTLPVLDMWVSFPAGLAIGSQGAISLLSNFIQIVEDCGS